MMRHEQGSESGGPPPLLRPGWLGDLALPNRVVMAPLTRARAASGELAPASLHAAYYAQRATAGLIITEGAWVSRRAIGFPGVPGIYSAAQVTAWRRVTGVVHALGGRIVLQLWHAGAHSHPDHHGGARPAGPSAVNPGEISPTPAGRKHTVTPREMTPADIDTAISDYGSAAAQARARRIRWRGDRRQRHVPDPPVPQPAAEPPDRRVRRAAPPPAAGDRRGGGRRLGPAAGRRAAVAVLGHRRPLRREPPGRRVPLHRGRADPRRL